MKKIILMSVGELMLKGQNRHLFEKKLVKNIKNSIKEMGSIHIECNQGRIYIRPESEDYRFSKAVLYLKKISGIANISIAIETEKDINTIKESINKYLEDALNNKQYKTFKVITKRADKLFSMSSPELAKELGGFILTEFSFLKVDVHNPELKLYVEIRDKTYIYIIIVKRVVAVCLSVQTGRVCYCFQAALTVRLRAG
jgi:thiamine biosynthesis protein ThiI